MFTEQFNKNKEKLNRSCFYDACILSFFFLYMQFFYNLLGFHEKSQFFPSPSNLWALPNLSALSENFVRNLSLSEFEQKKMLLFTFQSILLPTPMTPYLKNFWKARQQSCCILLVLTIRAQQPVRGSPQLAHSLILRASTNT